MYVCMYKEGYQLFDLIKVVIIIPYYIYDIIILIYGMFNLFIIYLFQNHVDFVFEFIFFFIYIYF